MTADRTGDAEPEISDAEVFARLPGSPIDRDTVAFFRGLLQRRLLVNRCAGCGAWHQPPWPSCPGCWSDDVRPTEVSGRGTVHSFTIVHTGRPLPDVDYARGHVIAVIDLAEQEGLRISATIVDCSHDDLVIGLPVRLTWIERAGEPVPAFAPARS